MFKKTIIVSALTIAFSVSAYASGSPVCAQVVNETNQTITLNVGNGNYIGKIINIAAGKNSTIFRATSVAPIIVFTSNTKRHGNISGTFVAYPGVVQLTQDGNITIQSANNYATRGCDTFWKISVFKG